MELESESESTGEEGLGRCSLTGEEDVWGCLPTPTTLATISESVGEEALGKCSLTVTGGEVIEGFFENSASSNPRIRNLRKNPRGKQGRKVNEGFFPLQHLQLRVYQKQCLLVKAITTAKLGQRHWQRQRQWRQLGRKLITTVKVTS